MAAEEARDDPGRNQQRNASSDQELSELRRQRRAHDEALARLQALVREERAARDASEREAERLRLLLAEDEAAGRRLQQQQQLMTLEDSNLPSAHQRERSTSGTGPGGVDRYARTPSPLLSSEASREEVDGLRRSLMQVQSELQVRRISIKQGFRRVHIA